MPRIRLITNLGTADAMRLGLDPAEAFDGAELDTHDDAAREAVRRNWARPVADDHAMRPGPMDLQAIPGVDIEADGDDAGDGDGGDAAPGVDAPTEGDGPHDGPARSRRRRPRNR